MNKLIERIRSTRRGSAIVAMVLFAVIIGFVVASLMSFAMQRRRETARMVLYNADLAAAEHILDRIMSTAFFVGQNSPRQYAGDVSGVRDLIAEMKDNTGAGHPNAVAPQGDIDAFDDLVEVVQMQAWGSVPIDAGVIAQLGPELAPWEGFNVQMESYRLMAWARANDDAGIAYSNATARPGVGVSRNVTYFAVPLFNYAIFYENLFELDGGQRIDVYGKVHTNEDWYLTTSSEVYYHQNCTVAGRFFGGIYNPLDGQRRGWFSGSNNINIAKTRNAGLGPTDPATVLSRLHNTSLINYNKGYLSSHIYNPASPASGNPIFNASEWTPADYDSNQDGTIDDMNGDGDVLDYLDGPDRFWADNPNWVDQSRSFFNDFLRDTAHGVGDVRLPIEEQNSPYLLIEPPNQASILDPSDPNGQRPKFDPNGKAIFLTVNDWDYKPLPGQTADDPNTVAPRYDKFDVSLAYQAAVVFEPQHGWTTLSTNTFNSRMTDANPGNDPVRAYRWVVTPGANPGDPPTTTKVYFTKLANGTTPVVTKTRIYNGREEKYVTTLDINAGTLASYLNNTTEAQGAFKLANPGTGLDGQAIDDGIIYVHLNQGPGTSSNGDANSLYVPANEQAGARIVNGADLNGIAPNSGIVDWKGLTFATNGPMYVKGDLNKTNRIPLMVAGDSINILSNNFSDSNYASGSGNGPNNGATPTETNAVFVSGNVPTRLNQYGGGGENYFRYLESWGSGNPHTFRGSMLNLFESRIALGRWDKDTGTGVNSGYYGPPRRNWGWDPNYASGQAPPGIPTARQMAIGRWQMMSAEEIQDVLNQYPAL